MAIVKMKRVELTCPKEKVNELLTIVEAEDDHLDSENQLEYFVACKDAEKFVNRISCDWVNVKVSDPAIDDKNVPVLLKGNWFTNPFIEFVQEHAKPAYVDFDPTLLFALGFCILFGIMFGDIGQGLVLVLIGLFYHKNKHAAVFARCGLFSILFGWLYGSIFGNEEILPEYMHEHALDYWHFGLLEKENTISLLALMLALGAILIIIAMIAHIIDAALEKRMKDVVAARNGVAGLLFYGSIFTLTVCVVLFGEEVSSLIWLICLATTLLACVMMLLLREGDLKERLEYLWETVLHDASSTVSFLMVGCYALAHATLMYVVYYLAELTPIPLIIIILGNCFVMGLEATEVWHECLSLCFKTLYPFTATEEHE